MRIVSGSAAARFVLVVREEAPRAHASRSRAMVAANSQAALNCQDLEGSSPSPTLQGRQRTGIRNSAAASQGAERRTYAKGSRMLAE